jgi:hypothetical protein
MSRVYLGVLCGLVFGGLDTALMIPLSFPDKRAAMLGAFIAVRSRICNLQHTTALAELGCRVAPRHPAEPS